MKPSEFKSIRQALGSQRAVSRMIDLGHKTIRRIEEGYYGETVPEEFVRMIRNVY